MDFDAIFRFFILDNIVVLFVIIFFVGRMTHSTSVLEATIERENKRVKDHIDLKLRSTDAL